MGSPSERWAGGGPLFLSSDINLPVAIKLASFHNVAIPRPKSPLEDFFDFLDDPQQLRREADAQEVYLTLQLLGNDKPLIPETTIPRIHLREWHRLPIKYRDLPLSARVVIKMWSCVAPRKALCIAGVSYSLFNKHQKLRKGKHKVQLWPIKEEDESLDYVAPGKISVHDDQVWRIEKLVQEFKVGQIPRVDWLDKITFKQIAEKINTQSTIDHMAHMFLEFPTFEYPVVFHEKDNPGFSNSPNIASETPLFEDRTGRKTALADVTASGMAHIGHAARGELKYTLVHDPETLRKDNPVENKYLKLMLYNRGLLDKDLKPDQKERNQLKRILNYPTTKELTAGEKEFLWKFRFYLKNNSAALTKFARYVDWGHRKERKQAMKLINEWEPIEVDHALELLSASFRANEGMSAKNALRRYAVKRLEEAKDEELMSYLLQLVQALRYEKGFLSDAQIVASQSEQSLDAPQATLSKKTSRIRDLSGLRRKTAATNNSLKRSLSTAPSRKDNETMSSTSSLPVPVELPLLAQFLIDRAIKNPKLANYLYWYLTVEASPVPKKSHSYAMSFKRTLDQFTWQLGETEEGQQQLAHFARQKKLIHDLIEMYHDIRINGKNVKKKTEKLRQYLEAYQSFDPFPHPLNPDIMVTGLLPEKAIVFGSATNPFKLAFRTTTGGSYTIIFKCGDDPRQDQLVIQLISLMDSLLKKVKFDLHLTPYAVLATSCNEGMAEFIPSVSLRTAGSIRNFLRQNHPQDDGPLGIKREALDRFIKSLAGYCVITYILGIGDRHNDNLLLRPEGNLFHIDFGYILGADPKSFITVPPPFKLTSLMVDAMGGNASEEYEQFKSYCCSCFIILRKNANLILNLFSLMVDADIPGIAALGGQKSILKVQEKFMLELTDEQAIKEFQDLMKASIDHMMTSLVDGIHDIAQKFK